VAKIALNKSELHKQNSKLKTYKKFLPSLELKRKQIIAERNKAIAVVEASSIEVEKLYERLAEEYKALSVTNFKLDNFVEIKDVIISEENLVGVHLPKISNYSVSMKPYGKLTAPIWVSSLFKELEKLAFLSIGLIVNKKRLEILEKALQKTTQRVNLFDKVLIPEAVGNIRKIKIYLSDFERAAVVQAKIAKSKNAINEILEKEKEQRRAS